MIYCVKVLGTKNSLALQTFNTVDRVFFPCVIEYVNILIRHGNSETKKCVVATRRVSTTTPFDQSIVHTELLLGVL